MSGSTGNARRLPFMQAPVRAMDEDGIIFFTIGTVLFAIGMGLCWWLMPWLISTDRAWWLGEAASGTVLGLIGTAFCLNRQRRRSRALGG